MYRPVVVLFVALAVAGCGSGADAPADDPSTLADETVTSAVNAETEAPEGETAQAFFARFKSTVRANDADAVANMAEFPFIDSGIDREEFLSTYYQSALGEGDFRDRLLAGSPGALEGSDDGRYYFSALVSEDCGEEAEEFDCESAVVFYFGQNEEGHWRLVDMMFAG